MEPDVTKGFYGNAVAGPVFKEIADKIFAYNLQLHKKLNQRKLLAKKSLPPMKPSKADEMLEILTALGIKNASFDFGYQWAYAKPDNGKILLSEKRISNSKMPDVTGMGLKDALFLLENKGLKVTIKGKGKVIRQSISNGSEIEKGQKVTIELRG